MPFRVFCRRRSSFFFFISHAPSSSSAECRQQSAAKCHAHPPFERVTLKSPALVTANERGYATSTTNTKSIHGHTRASRRRHGPPQGGNTCGHDGLGIRFSEPSLCSHDAKAPRHEPLILSPCRVDEGQEEGEDGCKPVNHGPSSSLVTDAESNASSDLQKKMKLLELEQWSPNDMAGLLKHKAFTSCSVEQLATVLRLLKECFGKKARQVLLKSPKALSYPLEALQKKLRVLMDLQFDKVAPHVSMLSISSELLQKKVAFYKDAGLTLETRHKMVLHCPRVLSCSIKDPTTPSLEFMESIGITRARVLMYCPIVLAAPCVTKLVHHYRFFKQMGFSALEFVQVLRSSFCLRNETLQLHIESMKELGFSEDDIRVMLTSQPSMVTLSPNNLRSKLDYVVNEQGRKRAEVVRYAVYFSYSLEGRIIPRFKSVEKLSLLKVYSLGTILGPSDACFEEWLRKKASSCL